MTTISGPSWSKKIGLIINVLRYSTYHFSRSLSPNFPNPYILSSGWILLPGASVPLLYQNTKYIPNFPLDDVYLGFLILASNLTLHNDFYIWGLDFYTCGLQVLWWFTGIMWKNMEKGQEAKCEPKNFAIKWPQ